MRAPILIVDDNPVNLKLISFVMKAEGYTCLTADSAEAALAVLRETKPSLILLDLQLPGMSGLELARHLRSQEETRDLVIVAVTANAMREHVDAAREAGCNGYISKPVDTRTLPELIRKYLA